MNLETRIAERLALLKEERDRRFTELAQFEAVIAELEQLLAPAAAADSKSEMISDLPGAPDLPPIEPPALTPPNGREPLSQTPA